MNLPKLFAEPHLLDLALALSGDSRLVPDCTDRLRRAGVPDADHAAFLRAAQVFEGLRREAHCATCHDPQACLDENTLAEFVDGAIPATELPAVERQLARCHSCLKKAVELAQWSRELAPEPHWTEVVLGMANRGLRFLSSPGAGFASLNLQPVAVMNDPEETNGAQCWSVTQGDIDAVFTMTVEAPGLVALQTRLIHRGAPPTNARMTLSLEGMMLESQLLPGNGEHTFWHLTPGRYTIEVEAPDQRIGAFTIELRDAA
jgi:anti-sigma factor RsiW